MLDFIQLHDHDNVIVALKDLPKGQSLIMNEQTIVLKDEIKRGHKIAIKDFSVNEHVIKYGYPIGHAIKTISVGEHIHTHNIKTNLDGIQGYQFHQKLNRNPYKNKNLTFNGYKRKNGNVGIRNELWIVPTVGCVNGIAERMLKLLKRK